MHRWGDVNLNAISWHTLRYGQVFSMLKIGNQIFILFRMNFKRKIAKRNENRPSLHVRCISDSNNLVSHGIQIGFYFFFHFWVAVCNRRDERKERTFKRFDSSPLVALYLNLPSPICEKLGNFTCLGPRNLLAIRIRPIRIHMYTWTMCIIFIDAPSASIFSLLFVIRKSLFFVHFFRMKDVFCYFCV